MVAKKLVFAMVAKKIVQIPLFYNIYSYAITNYFPLMLLVNISLLVGVMFQIYRMRCTVAKQSIFFRYKQQTLSQLHNESSSTKRSS